MTPTRIAALLGPTLVAVAITEWINIDVFIAASGPAFGPHVYLDGTLLFVAGLAIVRAHNRWTRDWTVLVTLVGWVSMSLGLARMLAPASAQQAGQDPAILYGSLVAALVAGIVLTWKAYRPRPGQPAGD